MASRVTRRALAGALPLFAIVRRARAAEVVLRFADGQEPTHPVNVRATEAAKAVAEATSGAVEIRILPNGQLGGDPSLIAQLRAGGLELANMGSDVLTTLVPQMAILNLGYAFNNYAQVWKAMDGPLGHYLTSKIDAFGIEQIGPSWDNGFRQTTTSTHSTTDVASLSGLKIRVPAAPMLTSLFRALGASPTPINFTELYTALQTHLVDGEENALPIIATAKLWEVQKYLSLTSHSWGAYLILGNKARLAALKPAYREAILQAFSRAGVAERTDIAHLAGTLADELKGHGMTVNTPDPASFRTKLVASGYYREWRTKFGEKAWGFLTDATGPLG